MKNRTSYFLYGQCIRKNAPRIQGALQSGGPKSRSVSRALLRRAATNSRLLGGADNPCRWGGVVDDDNFSMARLCPPSSPPIGQYHDMCYYSRQRSIRIIGSVYRAPYLSL